MERSEWVELEKLCRKLSDEYPENTHPLFESVRLTGAFAASTLKHWDVSMQSLDGGHDEAEAWEAEEQRRRNEVEYQRGIIDTQRAQERGPAGSPEREQGFREMEAQWEREGFDG
jgi:hypothetical protein